MKLCSIDGCENAFLARGWCDKHYKRWQAHGDPLGSHYHPVPCSVGGCEVISSRRGWCDNHYRRFMKWGDPTAGPLGPGSRTDEERFLQMVDKSGECWTWTGHRNAVGYGSFKSKGMNILAHRFAWSLYRGEIPEGMQIDHVCMNKSCVRVSHLRLATAKQNGEHKGVPRNNTSGYRGVTRRRGVGPWLAQVRHNGELVAVGKFDTSEEANAAVVAARLELFTHNELDKLSTKGAKSHE